MIRTKVLSLMLITGLLCIICLCGSAPVENGANVLIHINNEAAEEADEPDPEVTMENFVNKLNEGNYVVDAEGYLKTTVASPEQVYFTDPNDESSILNCAFVTLNGETFQIGLDEESLNSAGAFVGPGNAVEALGTYLPNGWIDASDGNMFNLFYNNVDDPLEFTSYDSCVKMTLLALGGYSENALEQMEEVHMLLNEEDPTSVHFTAVINDVGSFIHYDDLDLTLEFGAGESDPRADEWLSNPVYPPTRTDWTESDVYMLDIVFMRGCGKDAVPFPSFASYAMNFDDKAYDEANMIRVTDAHGTEEDLEAYKEMLLGLGFEEVSLEEEDGSTASVYRRMLREEYRCYVQLYPFYDNGFVLEGRPYYDNPVYDGLEAFSEALQQYGFAALEDTEIFDGWNAVDTAASRSEGWAYFFDYDFYTALILSFEGQEEAQAYFEDYGNKLLDLGFIASYSPGEGGGKYESANGFSTFRYTFEDEETVILEFKKEKSLSAEEASARISEHGLPEITFSDDIGSRDITRYYYEISGFTGLHLLVYETFDSTEEAERFLDDYTAVLDEEGYLMMDPQKLGSQKAFLYFNEELAKYVAFDYFPEDDGAEVNFDFVSIEPEEEGILQGVLKR